MNSQNTEKLDESISALQDCKIALTQLSQTCCMPERSPYMASAHLIIDKLILTANSVEIDIQNAQKCIEAIGVVGRDIGYLYATCCTATREPLYQRIFNNLMLVHVNSLTALGHSH